MLGALARTLGMQLEAVFGRETEPSLKQTSVKGMDPSSETGGLGACAGPRWPEHLGGITFWHRGAVLGNPDVGLLLGDTPWQRKTGQ